MTQYYDKHVFFCTNQREDGSACCGNHDAQKARDYVKDKVRDRKSTRLNSSH